MAELYLASQMFDEHDISNENNQPNPVADADQLKKKIDLKEENIYVNTIFDTPDSQKAEDVMQLRIEEILQLTGYSLFMKQNTSSMFSKDKY